MPAHSLIVAALCTVSTASMPHLPVEVDPPALSISVAAGNVNLSVGGHDQIFVGAILGSLAPDLAHYVVELPPLLASHVVVGVGIGYPDGGYTVSVPKSALPVGIPVYAQGVTLTEAGLLASDVGAIDLSNPQGSE